MARYRHMLALDVTHEFYGGTAMPGLRYVPTVETAALMAREGLLLRATAAGMELWQEQAQQADAQRSGEPWQLAIDVHASDALMRFYTAWPEAGYLPLVPGDARAVQLLRAVVQPAPQAADGRGGGNDRPVFWIDIACRPQAVAQPHQPVLPWRIALQAGKVHWKYFFSGGLAAKQLSIIDLDASPSEPGLSFARSPLAATRDGTAYLSAVPLPMRNAPQQRLQLRDEGMAGRVLIKRLPNANIEKVGKERDLNGQSMIVAEIYVHQ